MKIERGQIQGAHFSLFCSEKLPFFVFSGNCPLFLKQPLEGYLISFLKLIFFYLPEIILKFHRMQCFYQKQNVRPKSGKHG